MKSSEWRERSEQIKMNMNLGENDHVVMRLGSRVRPWQIRIECFDS